MLVSILVQATETICLSSRRWRIGYCGGRSIIEKVVPSEGEKVVKIGHRRTQDEGGHGQADRNDRSEDKGDREKEKQRECENGREDDG
jgi:hypothetical protein